MSKCQVVCLFEGPNLLLVICAATTPRNIFGSSLVMCLPDPNCSELSRVGHASAWNRAILCRFRTIFACMWPILAFLERLNRIFSKLRHRTAPKLDSRVQYFLGRTVLYSRMPCEGHGNSICFL